MKTNMKKIHLALAAASLASPAIITRGVRTHDSMFTMDAQTADSAGVFLIGELERLDQKLHMPLANVTWSRDIKLRSDVSMADEVTSFTNSSFAAAGGPSPVGKSWIGKDATAIAGIALDIVKTNNPLALWGMELGWTIPELLSSQKVGRPVDIQKYQGMILKQNMDIDEQVYIGDPMLQVTGLVNNASVTLAASLTTSGWQTATVDQILADVNAALNASWAASGFSRVPRKMGLPPLVYSNLVSRLISSAGSQNIIGFLRDNSLAMANNGVPLEIVPMKWLTGRGVNGTNRMIVYTDDEDLIRFPMVPMQRTPLEYRGLRQLTTYFCRLGVVEVVYPETILYVDGV